MNKREKYEIWMEGYAVTGNRCGASKLGTEYANSPEEALANYANKHKNDVDSYKREDGTIVYSDWGCKLFTNEEEARKSFG